MNQLLVDWLGVVTLGLPYELSRPGAAVLLVIILIAILFWLIQLIIVMLGDDQYFVSHAHRLVWFLVIFFTFLFGAIWFYFWRRIRLYEIQWERDYSATRQAVHDLKQQMKAERGEESPETA